MHIAPFPSLLRTNNPVILQLLLSLSGSVTDPLMRELTTRTVSSCPDLLLSYLRSLSTSFEPRANSRWMANVDFLIKVQLGYNCCLSDVKHFALFHVQGSFQDFCLLVVCLRSVSMLYSVHLFSDLFHGSQGFF